MNHGFASIEKEKARKLSKIMFMHHWRYDLALYSANL